MVTAKAGALKGVTDLSKADICAAKSDIRFTPNSDRESGFAQKIISALSPKADVALH